LRKRKRNRIERLRKEATKKKRSKKRPERRLIKFIEIKDPYEKAGRMRLSPSKKRTRVTIVFPKQVSTFVKVPEST
jgi:hypothetical protein